MTTLIADILTLLGVLGATVAVAGVARSRSLYMQVHASTLLIMAGALVVLAAAFTTGTFDIIGRSILVAGFLILTAPVSSHAIARLHYLIESRGKGPASEATGGP